MSDLNDWNKSMIEEFRANEGRLGGDLAGTPVLLLHHKGAKSGIERVNPVAYQNVGDAYAVFASFAGAPTNPDWYHNLVAHPEVSVEMGTEQFAGVARVTEGDERAAIWEKQKADFPRFAEYEKTTAGREIPVIVIERA